MKHSRLLLVLALVFTFGLSACGSPQSTDESTKAAEQFFAERGGGTSASGSAADVLNQPFVIGTVESVEGATIKVKSLRGPSVSVQLMEDAKIQEEAEANASEIQPGSPITVFGSAKDQAFQATLVQLGDSALLMDGMVSKGDTPAPGGGAMVQMPLPKDGAPAPGGGAMVQMPLPEGGAPMEKPAGKLLESLAGTVERVDGNTIVVKKSDGSTATIELAADAKIRKRQAATTADIQPGKTIMASGSKQGEMIEATQVQLISLFMP